MTLVPGTAADPGVKLLQQGVSDTAEQLYLQIPAGHPHHAHALIWLATARRPG